MRKWMIALAAFLLCGLMVFATAPEAMAEEENGHYLDINSTNFPDSNLRNWIVGNLDVSGTSGNYYMTKDQVMAVTEMYLKDQNIKNAKGIEHFTQLTRLVLWNNGLTKLDVSANKKLTYLDLENNQLTSLDLSNNTKLETLYTSGNCLRYLRLGKLTNLYGGTLGSQTVAGKNGAYVNGTYMFDLSKFIPLSMMKYVSVNTGSLNTSTGIVTFSSKVNDFSYYFETGSPLGSIYVCFYINDYTTLTKPTITTQPQTVTKKAGNTAKFTMKATGGQLTYRWQYRTSSSGSWQNISGATSNTYSFKVYTKYAGYQYRCVIKNAAGKTTSKAATLKMKVKPVIQEQPKSVKADLGATLRFKVKAGNATSYRWYYRKSSSDSWTATGCTKSTYTLTAKSKFNGYQYRCKITNAYGSVYTDTVKLSAGVPVISSNPKNVSTTAGKTVKFQVKVRGDGVKCTWYYRTSSKDSWKKVDVANGATTYTVSTNTLQVKASSKMHGYQYRCVITNKYGKVTSKAATLKIKTPTYRALLIGEEDFNPTCSRNRADAQNMAAMLGTVKGASGAKKYSTTVKIDLGYSEVEQAIKSAFAKTTDMDVSLFFIATHGNSDGDGELALTDGSFLDFSTLAGWLSQYAKGDVIVILESCGAGSAVYAGNGTKSNRGEASYDPDLLVQQMVKAFATVEAEEQQRDAKNSGAGGMRRNRFYVLAAAAHHEMSWGHEGSDPGNYFTDWLIEGIGASGKMPADTDSNKVVTLKELYKYIKQYDSCTFTSDGYEYHQHVQVYPENSSYKLFRR